MVRTSRPLYHLTPTKVAISSIASTKRCHMPARSTRTASCGSSTAITGQYGASAPTGLQSPPPASAGHAGVRSTGFSPIALTLSADPPSSRALRQALEAVLREFHGGDHDGPVARRLIAVIEKETARQREIWDARRAKLRALGGDVHHTHRNSNQTRQKGYDREGRADG